MTDLATGATASYLRRSISSAAAHEVVRAARARAEMIGVASSIAVVNESGVLKAFVRMDGAPFQTVAIAQDKAYTAAGFGLPTEDRHERLEADPPLALGAPARIERFIVVGGGCPLAEVGSVVGGIGFSGGSSAQDIEVARAGMSALGDIQQTDELQASRAVHTSS